MWIWVGLILTGSFSSANAANCPEANLRVRSSYVPIYIISEKVASSETLEDGDVRLNYDSLIQIPNEYVVCNGKQIDYQRSLLRWSQKSTLNSKAKLTEEKVVIAKIDANQKFSDVFFPTKIQTTTGDSNLPAAGTQTYLNLMTLYNEGFLVPAHQKNPKEAPITVNKSNNHKLISTYVPREGNASPANLNVNDSKNYKRLLNETLTCDQGGKNVCEDIKPVLPLMTRTFFNKYQGNLSATFIEAYAPIALWMQIQTGVPASQLLAQIIQETGYTTSEVYLRANNIGGISCGSAMIDQEKIVDLYGKTFFISDKDCRTPRPEGGNYFSYNSVEESILHWINLFTDKSQTYYPALRAKSQQAKANGAFNVVQFNSEDLRPYAVPPEPYMLRIHELYNQIEGQYKFRTHPCQVCLQNQWERANPAKPRGVQK